MPVAHMAMTEQIADAIDQHVPKESSSTSPPPIPADRSRKRKKRQSNEPPLHIQRGTQDWMSFKCSCGHAHTLSPSFSEPQMTCQKCGRTIEID
ncbi:MAG: hypothetical protein COA73_11905 [Candidatus Hydrogenedentota bacterium]|nr:MAG: hypothetical protein COA73_11905 [Candidatus Hydrogenedentota bacterium]